MLSLDPARREALMSCGAVLDHFRVAAAAAGWIMRPEYFPNPNDLTHLATMNFAKMQYVTEAHHARLRTSQRRYTDRLPFLPRQRWSVAEQLIRQAVGERAFLNTLDSQARPRVVEAAQLSNGLRQYDSAYGNEIDWWPTLFKLSAGIPESSLLFTKENERSILAGHSLALRTRSGARA